MYKSKLLISSCILCALSNSALAAMDIRGERTSFYERNKPKPIGFNYTYAEATYVSTNVDNTNSNDDSAQGTGIKISFKITPNTSGSLTFLGSGYNSGNEYVEATELHIGANYHHPLNKDTEAFAEFSAINLSFDDPNNSNSSASASGKDLSVGIRQRINADMEWGISVTALSIEDDTNTKIRLNYSYGADDEIQYIGGFETINTDNKTTSFFLGVRFNY